MCRFVLNPTLGLSTLTQIRRRFIFCISLFERLNRTSLCLHHVNKTVVLSSRPSRTGSLFITSIISLRFNSHMSPTEYLFELCPASINIHNRSRLLMYIMSLSSGSLGTCVISRFLTLIVSQIESAQSCGSETCSDCFSMHIPPFTYVF